MSPQYFALLVVIAKFCEASFIGGTLDFALTAIANKGVIVDKENDTSSRLEEDRFLTTLQLIRKHGYPAEEHKIITEDGYVLTLFRIPYGLKSKQSLRKKPVVLIQHGFVCASIDWLMNTEHKALPYKLADAGYDVFLGNLRGNPYAKENIHFTTQNPDFWKFSWHEMGIYDMPAMIDYILHITKQPSIYYIGHSMGNNVLYVCLTTFPEYNSKIILQFALAPAIFVNKRGSPLKMLAPLAVREQFALDTLGHNELVITSVLTLIKKFGNGSACDRAISKEKLCFTALHIIAGINESHLNKTWLPIIASHYPSSASSRTFIHFLQVINSRKFQKYDHGHAENQLRYGQPTPPEYDLSKVTIPVVIMWAKDDDLITPPDVARLAKILPNVIYNHRVQAKSFKHVGFLYGIYANELVYEPIITMMRDYDYRK